MQPSSNPLDQQLTWKQWLLRAIASMSLVAALTAALIAITPLLSGHPNWPQIAFTFFLVLVFAAMHSLTATIPDPALRAALSVVLDKLEQILAQLTALSSRLSTIEQRTGRSTDTNPNDPRNPYRS